MNTWAALLLAAALVLPLLQFRRARPRRARAGNRFRHMATGALCRFGLPVPVLLLVAGRFPALATMPREFVPVTRMLGLGDPGDPWIVGGFVTGALLGMAAASALAAMGAWRGWRVRRWFGDFAALEASEPSDCGWAAWLSLVAGVTEEGYFRLLLPLLAAMTGVGAAAGFAGSTLLFGALHRYQGWRGVATTTVVGAAMAALYLASGSLLLAMAYHAMVDVGSLVVRPWIRRAVERRIGSRNRLG